MATLHMNTDQAHSTATTIRSSASELQASVNTANNSVNSMMSEWQGNSATQFQGEYEQWRNAANNAIQALESLAGRLEAEISEWESMAQNL